MDPFDGFSDAALEAPENRGVRWLLSSALFRYRLWVAFKAVMKGLGFLVPIVTGLLLIWHTFRP